MIDWPAEQRKVAERLFARGLVSYAQCRHAWYWVGASTTEPFTFHSVVVPAAGNAPMRVFLATEIP